MAIPVTTRSGKGAPLTQNEMDTNLTNLARDATETQQGNIEIATTAETTAGTETDKAVVPSGLQAALDILQGQVQDSGAFLASQNGYVQFPDWLGNITIQWGRTGTLADGGSTTVTFPVPFVQAYTIVVSPTTTGFGHVAEGVITSTSTATVSHADLSGGASSRVSWVAFGTGNQP